MVRGRRQSFPCPEFTPVLRVDIEMGVGGLGSWIVEDRAVRGGRNLFRARRLTHMNVEIPVDDVCKGAVGFVTVRILRNSVVRCRTVGLRKEQSAMPLAVIERARKQSF